jgi:hypothetical protein
MLPRKQVHYGAFTPIFVAVAVSREIRPATN